MKPNSGQHMHQVMKAIHANLQAEGLDNASQLTMITLMLALQCRAFGVSRLECIAVLMEAFDQINTSPEMIAIVGKEPR